MRKTKIVCTIGDACCREDILEQMLAEGMNVARFNFSHGDHAHQGKMIDTFYCVRERLGISAASLLDTKGPEIRIRKFKNGKIELREGDEFTLTVRDVEGDEKKVSITYAELPQKLHRGTKIRIDDGKVAMTVTDIAPTQVKCVVDVGGVLSDNKSINIPDVPLHMPYLSDADKADLRFGISKDIDFVAASFVRNQEDVLCLRRFLKENGGESIRIISKIENAEGVEHIDEILRVSDGIMVARGDMGVEIAFERLPGLQKEIIRKCCKAGKPVITATQMLESMISLSTPTRAEISDVANAVFDGTSAVMLSGETAAGKHPVLVVKTMRTIVEQAEKDMFMRGETGVPKEDGGDVEDAICHAAKVTAESIGARAILAVTKSGITARGVSGYCPLQTVAALTPEIKTFWQLSLCRGVVPILSKPQNDTDSLFAHAIDCAKGGGIVQTGDIVVITSGVPLHSAGNTNILKVQKVP